MPARVVVVVVSPCGVLFAPMHVPSPPLLWRGAQASCDVKGVGGASAHRKTLNDRRKVSHREVLDLVAVAFHCEVAVLVSHREVLDRVAGVVEEREDDCCRTSLAYFFWQRVRWWPKSLHLSQRCDGQNCTVCPFEEQFGQVMDASFWHVDSTCPSIWQKMQY